MAETKIQWTSKPSVPGRYLHFNGRDYLFLRLDRIRGDEGGRYYGPIPEDEFAEFPAGYLVPVKGE